MKYEIIDNFLNKENFIKIKNLMLDSYFPWYFNKNVSIKNISEDGFYFTHSFYKNFTISSDKTILLDPLILKIKPKSIIRIKGNFYPQTQKIMEHGKHVDYTFKHKGFIFYINNNNGFTKLKDGTIIESIENRGLFFDPSIEHNSSTCTNQFGRININFNYF
jgi:hypothetical protein